MLRRELALEAGEIPDGAVDGKRLSAAETGREPGVYVADADGLEALTPDDAQPLSPARVDALLAASPERAGAGRLQLSSAASKAMGFGGTTVEIACL